ncbi:MAG: type I-F CRISPR-associated protein Csy1 [Desulfotalea sp.]|nr:MAG: type I-F CRISPR-associated protein Csy1 [Desulfotalea sp.]
MSIFLRVRVKVVCHRSAIFCKGGMMECSSLSDKILDYIINRAKPKLETHDKQTEKERRKIEKPKDVAKFDAKFSKLRSEIEAIYVPASWLTVAAKRAKQIEFVTHPVKLSNPLIKGGSSCLALKGAEFPQSMSEGEVLSTASLVDAKLDVVGNAAALDVVGLLQLEHGGKTLAACIQEQDAKPLEPFAENSDQLKDWMRGFGAIFSSTYLRSHKYAKQLYFPVGEREYHLLAPLYSSSLVHAVYERIARARFSEQAKETRKAWRRSRFSENIQVEYPDTAIQIHGGTKPQNISMLTSRRRGRSYLFSCGPPGGQVRSTPPLMVQSIFMADDFTHRVNKEILQLQNCFEPNHKNNGDVNCKSIRDDLLDIIVDTLFQYGAEIQSLTSHAGWTRLVDCKLSLPEQLWLDPHRRDGSFMLKREKKEWQGEIAAEFVFWLNKRLKSAAYLGSDSEHSEWEAVVEKKSKLFKEDLEVFA